MKNYIWAVEEKNDGNEWVFIRKIDSRQQGRNHIKTHYREKDSAKARVAKYVRKEN